MPCSRDKLSHNTFRNAIYCQSLSYFRNQILHILGLKFFFEQEQDMHTISLTV
jgi:hypothetical protein